MMTSLLPRLPLAAICFLALPALAQSNNTAVPAATPTQLTIYNGDFAVARTSVPLDLHAGTNEALTTDVTSQLEADSVVLRDPAGQHPFRIVEQNYDAGVVNQGWMLKKFEGKTLDFRVRGPFTAVTDSGQIKTVPEEIVQARIVRAGDDPLIEVSGHLQFQLPGTPIFPATTDGLLLKPTLRWQIESAKPEHFNAELDYITHGMSWQSTYNVVVPESSGNASTEKADILGWVTIQNNSGTDFPQTTIQLMAGDVAKLAEQRRMDRVEGYVMAKAMAAPVPAVTQKEFDDFHLYDLHRTVSLPNKESKQVQFLEAGGVTVTRTYKYDGAQLGFPYGSGYHYIDRDYGATQNKTVAIREEIKNSEANHLGMPLPAGRLRLYRRETTGQMQFVGESQIQHTPADQKIDVTSGNAFDLTGERKQTDFHVDTRAHNIDESFEIKLSNAKSQPVTIHAIEHMNRAQNWQVTAKSSDFIKQDSATLDFPVSVPAKGSATLTYTVHYSW